MIAAANHLRVHLVSGTGLSKKATSGAYGSNYVKFKIITHTGFEKLNRKFGQTCVAKASENPVWNETFVLPQTAIRHDLSYFVCEVYERKGKNEMQDEYVGGCRLYFEYANENHLYCDAWHTLTKPHTAKGALHIQLTWCSKEEGTPVPTFHLSTFGMQLDLCPLDAYPFFYHTFDGKAFPGENESIYELVEEAIFQNTIGSLYCTQYRCVFCPYNQTSSLVVPFYFWLGTVYKVVTETKEMQKPSEWSTNNLVAEGTALSGSSLPSGKRSNTTNLLNTISGLSFFCKDGQQFYFQINAWSGGENVFHDGVSNTWLPRAIQRRQSLKLEPRLWATAVCASAQRFVEEVEWQIHERGWSTEIQNVLMKDVCPTDEKEASVTDNRFNPCREKYVEKHVVVVMAVVPNPSEDKMLSLLRKDYARQGMTRCKVWALSRFNEDFGLCPSYSRHLVFPSKLDLATLQEGATFRSKARLPALTWLHPFHHAPLCRCAQPKTGFSVLYSHNQADRKILAAIKETIAIPSTKLRIFDCRPWENAAGNKIIGGGTEKSDVLGDGEEVQVEFLDIANIHAMRNSFQALVTACRRAVHPKKSRNFFLEIGQSLWLMHLLSIIVGSDNVAKALSDGEPCVVHCSDGWDRTSQVCAIAQILLDPYYRTIEGFGILVTKEFCAFGFQFAKRGDEAKGKDFEKGECSPVFLQFVDAVYQIYSQFPTRFEFNETFLLFIASHIYSGIFGNFLYNCEQDREEAKMKGVEHVDIWEFTLDNAHMFYNLKYDNVIDTHSGSKLRPSRSPSSICLWKNLYLRCWNNASVQVSSISYETDLQNRIGAQKHILAALEHQQQLIDSSKKTRQFVSAEMRISNEKVPDGKFVHRNAVLNTRRRVAKRFSDIKLALSEMMPLGSKLTVTVPMIQITKDKEKGRKFAQYLVEVSQFEPTIQTWGVYRRMSQFYQLREYFCEHGISLSVDLPEKTWVHSFDSSFLEKRKAVLNEYCYVLSEQYDLFSSSEHYDVLKSFLTEGVIE
jgi:hypothetical protein